MTGCQWSGTAVVELPLGEKSGGMSVFGTPPEYKEPYTYGIRIVTPSGSKVTFTRHDCPEGAAEYEGTEETIAFVAELDTGSQESADGIAYMGSDEEVAGSATTKKSWSFEGKP